MAHHIFPGTPITYGSRCYTDIEEKFFGKKEKFTRHRCSKANGCPAWKCNIGKKMHVKTKSGWIWKTIRIEEHVIDEDCPLHHS